MTISSHEISEGLLRDDALATDTSELREYARFRERYIFRRTFELYAEQCQAPHAPLPDCPTPQRATTQPMTQPVAAMRPDPPESTIHHYAVMLGLAVLRWFQANWLLVVLSVIEMTLVGLRGVHLRYNLLLYVITVFIRFMWNNIRVEGSNRDGDGNGHLTTFLGKYFARQDGPDGRRNGGTATSVKLCYMVLKCAETLVLSLSPFYSTERLEMELQLDGVVRENANRLRAVRQTAAPPVAPPPFD